MIRILFLVSLTIVMSCSLFDSKKDNNIPDNWEMIDMFEDQITEIQEGGYYALYRNEPRPASDSIPPDEEINDNVVAIAVQDELVEGKSKAVIWVADSKQTLTLEKNETEKDKKYHRVYENKDFSVDLDMKFSNSIDGLDEVDMMIYRGKMKVTEKESSKSKELKVKGGI